jgi:AcrR family transcriptional regulator
VIQTRSRVLAATRRLIAEEGISSATIERIASDSGVARSTIYRRWGNLDALYADALLASEVLEPAPPTGDIRTDLRRYLADYVERLNDPTQFGLLLSLVQLAGRDPRFAEVHRRTVHEPVSEAARIIEAAQGAGVLRSDLDSAHALGLLIGPALCVRLIEHRRITPADIDRCLDDFLRGFAKEGPTRR